MKILTLSDDEDPGEIANEGLFGWLGSSDKKEDAPKAFDMNAAFDKIRLYDRNPDKYVVDTTLKKLRSSKLYISLKGTPPQTAMKMALSLEYTFKQAFSLANKFDKDRLSQAYHVGTVINTFDLNMSDYMDNNGKVHKTIVESVMRRLIAVVPKVMGSYFQQFGRTDQRLCDTWLGGNPFNLKLKPDTNIYKNARGKLKPVGPPPLPDIAGIKKLVKVMLQYSDGNNPKLDNAALDDQAIKYYVDYRIDRTLKHLSNGMTAEQKAALRMVFSGDSNTQALQFSLCESMKKVYSSILIYLDSCIAENKT